MERYRSADIFRGQFSPWGSGASQCLAHMVYAVQEARAATPQANQPAETAGTEPRKPEACAVLCKRCGYCGVLHAHMIQAWWLAAGSTDVECGQVECVACNEDSERASIHYVLKNSFVACHIQPNGYYDDKADEGI